MGEEKDGCLRLAEELTKCADALQAEDGPDEEAPLRKLQRVANSLLFRSGDVSLRTIAFLLDEWVREYYFNFAGDVLSPASESIDMVRRRFLREQVAPSLKRMSEEVMKGGALSSAFENLVVGYLDAIREANEYVGEW